MRSFRKIICRIMVLLVFVLLVNKVSRYMYESRTNPLIFTREELKETKGTVDTVLLGTSLVAWGLDPAVISEELDGVCFNLGTESQPVSGAYFLLKDQIRVNPVKRVFLGIGVAGIVEDNNTVVGRRLAILDRMFSPLVKAEYMLTDGSFRDYEQFLLYPTRVENRLNFQYVKKNIAYKQSEDFQNKIPPSYADWQYIGMGFKYNDQVYDGSFHAKKLKENGIWNRDSVEERNIEYIRKMAKLCKKNNIDFNIVIFPHAYEFAKLQGDLSDMDAYFEELCQELEIGLFDYNYTAYEGIYDILPNEYYWDRKHLNKDGAAAIAHLLCSDYKERMES